MGFIRVKLIEVEPAASWSKNPHAFESYCAVHIKEAVMSATQGISLVQKKKTIYPEWNKCFDTHLYDGRVITIVVLQKPSGRVIAEVSIGVQFLVDQCKRDTHGFSSVWVSWMHFTVQYFSLESMLHIGTVGGYKKQSILYRKRMSRTCLRIDWIHNIKITFVDSYVLDEHAL